jgi:hypothetical protein
MGLTSLENVSISDKVTSIGDIAFYGCIGLTSVTIPASVTSIGLWAFYGCTGITELTIADSEKELSLSCGYAWYETVDENGEAVYEQISISSFSGVAPTKVYLGRNISGAIFTNDTNLSDLTIGDKVTAINDSEFSGCTGLSAVTLPSNIETLGSSAFNGCTGLTSLLIPGSTTSIGASAFSGCTGIAELNIADSENELTIGDDAFTDVKPTKAYLGRDISSAIFTNDVNLSDLTIGDKVTAINDGEFYRCIGIPELLLPNSVTSIGSSAFSYCTTIAELTIPNSVTSIGASAFSGCMGIEKLKFDDGENELTLGASAFNGVSLPEIYFGRQMNFAEAPVSALETVEFGEAVTSIEAGTFKEATSLVSVTSHNAVPPTTEDPFSDSTYLYGTLYVPETSVDAYKEAAGWKNFFEIVGLEVSGIAEVGHDAAAKVSVDGGAICVDGDADVRIVSTNGATVYSGRGETRINVTPGIYVVVINNSATKVAVK